MIISEINEITQQHMDLLLEADPSPKLVLDYVSRGQCFQAVLDESLVGVLVVLPTHPETLEIMNISVSFEQQNQGIGQQLLEFAEDYARKREIKSLEIGTGSTSLGQLYLYQKCGFRVFAVDQDFFTVHYQQEIIENKLVLKDMLRLRKVL